MKISGGGKRVIELLGISKSFPGVQAVSEVDFVLESGSVHALVGENGAGKSTLMKILAGVYRKDKGTIKIDGKEVAIEEPADAKGLGVAMIQQEFSLFSELNGYQNTFIGKEPSKKLRFLVDWRGIKNKTKEIWREMGLDVDINRPIKRLATSDQQIIEIAKSVFFGSTFIIMDEPTSSLGEEEKKRLFRIIRNLKSKGVGIIYISHRLEEIFDIADYVTVMRDGKKIGTYPISEVNESKLITLMVGRELTNIFRRERKMNFGYVVLEVKNLTKRKVFHDISFQVRQGEILGLSGLMGSKRTDIVKCIFGLESFDDGEIFFLGEKIKFRDPSEAINKGIALVPEDRKKEGIIDSMSVKENLIVASLRNLNKAGWIDRKQVNSVAARQVAMLGIKIASFDQPITKLSGGNQQKVILGRLLSVKPKLLILDEPTRGIDVGAKAEVHKIIDNIAANGVAIIMISSELPEILGASDRIIVLHQGKITAEYNYLDATQENILANALKSVGI
jgi:ribose transport system ATP-binding protein